jgi:hypothetical protein
LLDSLLQENENVRLPGGPVEVSQATEAESLESHYKDTAVCFCCFSLRDPPTCVAAREGDVLLGLGTARLSLRQGQPPR